MRISLFILALGASAASGTAQPAPMTATTEPSSATVAVDRELGDLTIEAQPIGAVLEVLGEKAGVKFVIDEDLYGLLPWGRDTRLASVTLKGATLRGALNEIGRTLGLIYEVGDRSIRITACGPLNRLNRRATWNDLNLLRTLETTEFTAANLAKVKMQYRITSKVNAPQLLAAQLKRAGEGTISQVLETAANALGWTWYPDQDHIVMLSAEANIARALSRSVTARYNQMGLAHILLDLADKADVALSLEPGLLLKLPPSTAQSYTLLLQQTTIREALELICAETGLTYQVKRDGLAVSLAGGSPGSAVGPRPRTDSYAARILVPAKDGGFSYEFLLRESELPQDIREYRGQIVAAMIERMRQDMAPAEGGEPTTRPHK